MTNRASLDHWILCRCNGRGCRWCGWYGLLPLLGWKRGFSLREARDA